MKTVIKILLLSGLVLAGVSAQDQINAVKVPGNVGKIGPESKAWFSTKYIDVMLYPQTINKVINDEASMLDEKVKKARVKALYDGNNISFLIEWKDTTKDTNEDCCSKARVDGFALQFPTVYSDVSKLPYISMGSKDRPVVIHLKKADKEEHEPNGFQALEEYYDAFHEPIKGHGKVEYGRVFVMEGFRSMAESKNDNSSGVMDMIYKDGTWKGALSRPLKAESLDLRNGAFPVSFVTWDGNLNNSDVIEHFSSWIGVKLLGERGGDELLEALKSQGNGDIYNGKKLAIENCAACHNFEDSVMAPVYMAPNLSNVGGYSTVQYLLESIVEPNAVVVPNYKPNMQPDFPWYNLDEDNNRISTMPSYDWMDEKSKNDLVTYFKTLKAEAE
jgi:complex iron-sulfur molybdoenzyme family reductase subunit gamma